MLRWRRQEFYPAHQVGSPAKRNQRPVWDSEANNNQQYERERKNL